jgi:hypothetical protein
MANLIQSVNPGAHRRTGIQERDAVDCITREWSVELTSKYLDLEWDVGVEKEKTHRPGERNKKFEAGRLPPHLVGTGVHS